METKVRKPASLWLKLTMLGALIVGFTVVYEVISTSGRSYFPSISLTGNRSYTLRVTGASGLRFCGAMSVRMADGTITSHTLEGVVPETFKMFGRSVSITFQKCEESGSLKVAIANNNNPLVEESTTGRYGTVSINAN